MTRQNFQGTEWANSGAATDPGGAKKDLGWIAEKPGFQTANFVENRQDEMLSHLEEFGIAVWDTNTEYNNKSYAAGSDGLVYKSKTNSNQGNNPVPTPGANWELAFMDLTTTQTVTGTKTMDALKLGGNQDANNKKITTLAPPTSNQDAATKAYADSLVPFGLAGGNDSVGSTQIGQLKLAWGSVTVAGNGNEVISVTGFAAVFQAFCNYQSNSVSIADSCSTFGFSSSGFTIFNSQSISLKVSWFAIGR